MIKPPCYWNSKECPDRSPTCHSDECTHGWNEYKKKMDEIRERRKVEADAKYASTYAYWNNNKLKNSKEEKQMANIKLKDLAPGTVFDAGPIDVRVLEHLESGITLLIADTSIAERHFADQPFKLRPEKPTPFPNDWRFSNLRDELNGEFLESFDNAEGPVRSSYIVTADWNLKDHEGGEGYGIIEDKVCLLTEEQFKKYSAEGLLDLEDWWWLATPNAGRSDIARNVYPDGSLYSSGAAYGNRGVRPAFYVESEIVISQEPDTSLLKEFTIRELVEEMLSRIGNQERNAL